MKLGTAVNVRNPRNGNTRPGKLLKKHSGHNGEWWEIKPPEKGAETFRCRPAMVTPQ